MTAERETGFAGVEATGCGAASIGICKAGSGGVSSLCE